MRLQHTGNDSHLSCDTLTPVTHTHRQSLDSQMSWLAWWMTCCLFHKIHGFDIVPLRVEPSRTHMVHFWGLSCFFSEIKRKGRSVWPCGTPPEAPHSELCCFTFLGWRWSCAPVSRFSFPDCLVMSSIHLPILSDHLLYTFLLTIAFFLPDFHEGVLLWPRSPAPVTGLSAASLIAAVLVPPGSLGGPPCFATEFMQPCYTFSFSRWIEQSCFKLLHNLIPDLSGVFLRLHDAVCSPIIIIIPGQTSEAVTEQQSFRPLRNNTRPSDSTAWSNWTLDLYLHVHHPLHWIFHNMVLFLLPSSPDDQLGLRSTGLDVLGRALRLPMNLWDYTANQTGNAAKSSRCCFNDNLNSITSSSDGNERDREALGKILYLKMCRFGGEIRRLEVWKLITLIALQQHRLPTRTPD